MKILIIGKGFIGTRCKEMWSDAVLAEEKIYTREDAQLVLDTYNPDVVLNAAGITGKPNVDWCETHQIETWEGNTVLPLLIAEACQARGVYMLHLGTGCIFYGASPDPKGWKETDYANPVAVYTRSKYAADLVLETLPNVGIARLRMPIDDRPCQPNLIDKLVRYTQIVDVENSVTVVSDLIDALHQLLEKRASGIFHTVNPGIMRNRDLLQLYQELVDPTHTNEWITEQELVTLGLAKKKRSNNIMQSENLEKLGIHMRPIDVALRDTMEKYADKIKELRIKN